MIVGTAHPEGAHKGHAEHFADGDQHHDKYGNQRRWWQQVEEHEACYARCDAGDDINKAVALAFEAVHKHHLEKGDEQAVEGHQHADKAFVKVPVEFVKSRLDDHELVKADEKANTEQQEQQVGEVGINRAAHQARNGFDHRFDDAGLWHDDDQQDGRHDIGAAVNPKQ